MGEGTGGKVGWGGVGEWVSPRLIRLPGRVRLVTKAQGAEDPHCPSIGVCTPSSLPPTHGCLPCHLRLPPHFPRPVTGSASPPNPHPRLMLHSKLNQGQTEGCQGRVGQWWVG